MADDFVVMPVIISLGFFAMIVTIVWLGTSSRNRRAQVQADVQSKLIERFGTAKEFIDFLQSPAGREFVTGVEVTTTLYARDRIISGFSKGTVLSLLGLGFLAIWIADHNRGFMYPGFILLGLGAGFFLSTLVALKLQKSYGLVGGQRDETAPPSNSDLSATRL